LRYYYW